MLIILIKFFLFSKLYIFSYIAFSAENFDNFKLSIIKQGLEKGISLEVLNKNLNPIKNINKKVLSLYNNQPEFKITFNSYRKRNINASRISKGKKLLIEHENILTQIKNKYTVAPEIIVAIWALESNYGHYITHLIL